MRPRHAAYAAFLLVLLAVGFVSTAGSTPPCWSQSPNRPASCFTTSTTTTTTTTTPSTTTTTVPTTTTTPTGTLYVDHDPASPTLAPWTWVGTGTPAGSESYCTVASGCPTGITLPPGTVRSTTAPDGVKAFDLTTTPTANFVSGSQVFDRVDLFMNNGVAFYSQGSETWEHFRVMFPDGWQPVRSGGWSWFWQHHDRDSAIHVPGIGIVLGYWDSAAPAFYQRVVGGNVNAWPAETDITGPTIVRNHWYDMLYHIKWSTGSDGIFEWWVDGQRLASLNRPTLAYNGTVVDEPNYQLSNYHTHTTWNSTILFSRLKIGTTQGVVSDLG
jgi:hypothetical protein